MITSASLSNLATALAAAQAEMETADKENFNPHLRVKYADLASIWRACRGPLSKNGLSVVQGLSTSADGTKASVTTRLLHSSGEWIESEVSLSVVEAKGLTAVQAFGSVITYARRYALAAKVGVTPDDDDGSDGSGRQPPPPPATRPTQPPAKPAPNGASSAGSAASSATAASATSTTAPVGNGVAVAEIENLKKKLRESKTPAELDEHVKEFKGRPESDLVQLRPVYLQRMNELTRAPEKAPANAA